MSYQQGRNPIVRARDFCEAMGMQTLGDLMRKPDAHRAELFEAFEEDVARGIIPSHGELAPSTPPVLARDPALQACRDTDLVADGSVSVEHRRQLRADGVPSRFQRLWDRRVDAYLADHGIDVAEARWHALNDLCKPRHAEDGVRTWARMVRAARVRTLLARRADRRA